MIWCGSWKDDETPWKLVSFQHFGKSALKLIIDAIIAIKAYCSNFMNSFTHYF